MATDVTKSGYCPFCNGVVQLDPEDKPWTIKICDQEHQFQACDALVTPAVRVPGWVFTNLHTATNIMEGRYIYNLNYCIDGRAADDLGAELLDYWDAHDYRRAEVFWEINCPVPKNILEGRLIRINAKREALEAEWGKIQDQIQEYYPNV